MPERIYPELTPEQKESVIREFRRSLEAGGCSPKLNPSLLGLDWELFETREFPEHANDVCFSNPPEFISLAFSALDAYATAMLAAHLSIESLGCLQFTCSLKRRGPQLPMYLEFATTPEQGRINPDSIMAELLGSFPKILNARGFKDLTVMFMEGEGCVMEFEYSGNTLAEVSPFLRDRPDDPWPQVKLSLIPTDELKIRAQTILAFLLTSKSAEGKLN
ncbi:MAG TPA: hypothetical protein VGR47_02610 [Terracidiphilus sp.]|nr:hypothetical protein [Terracidiphilus sp.]